MGSTYAPLIHGYSSPVLPPPSLLSLNEKKAASKATQIVEYLLFRLAQSGYPSPKATRNLSQTRPRRISLAGLR